MTFLQINVTLQTLIWKNRVQNYLIYRELIWNSN